MIPAHQVNRWRVTSEAVTFGAKYSFEKKKRKSVPGRVDDTKEALLFSASHFKTDDGHDEIERPSVKA